ncbi:MAG TPA: TIGR02186 family protein [Nitrospirota bacterium]|nr:TIGR02186 family protein [Nitrospirota bacterium]
MKKMRVRIADWGIAMITALAFIFILVFTGSASAMLTARANHDHITIDFFYHGSTVSVRGESDPNVDLVIKITAPEEHQVLKQKGKVGGLLWMNVGQLKFEHTPNFYAVYSTRKLDEMLDREEMEKYVIGYPALEKHVSVTPAANEEEKTKWFNEFVKFKEASNVYVSSFGKISTVARADGRQEYSILTDWPYQAAPGDYLVTVYAVNNGKVVEQAEAKVNVEQAGLVKTLSTMAKNSAALYGILSIGIALGAGFGVGLVFRKGGGSH